MVGFWVRFSYSVILALIVALTLGFAVDMVIPGPRPPDTPSLTFRDLQGTDTQQDSDALIGVVDRFYQDSYDYRRAYPDYQRNVLIATVILATFVGAAGVALGPEFNYLRLGLTLAAILLLIYGTVFVLSPVPNPAPTDSGTVTDLLAAGVPPGLQFADRFLRFAVSFIALLVFLFLGLWRLTEWPPAHRGVEPATPPIPGPVPTNVPASTSEAAPTGALGAIGSFTPREERVLWGRPDDR